jgi:protein-S-isoprenylcysteine O-methyltransferase Ste14
VGVVLCFLGGLLRIIPVYALRNRFSGLVAIQPGHVLETAGIYGVVRNPSYLGLLITSLGWVLTFRSHFGAEYEAYCARTWRLLPWIY